MLGILKYGQRLIAKSIHEEIELRKNFWSLFSTHLIFSIVSLLLYCLFTVYFVEENFYIFIIESIYVASALFDITWLFYGLENFRNVVVKNAAVKIFELILVFRYVKCPDDLWIYALISSIGIFLGQIALLPNALKAVPPIKFKIRDMKVHLKPMLILSISVIAVSLYTVFDKTLLGILTPKENVAFYEYSNKIVNIPKTFISVIGTVMFSRACKYVAINDMAMQKKYANMSLMLTGFIGMGAIFGLMGVSETFVLIYYGQEFTACAPIIVGLAPLVIVIGIGDIIRTQYMIPNEMDAEYIKCSIYNAIVNLVLSISLITLLPENFKIFGAVVGTVSAELFGCIYQFNLCKDFIKIKDIITSIFPFFVNGLVMWIILIVISANMNDSFFKLLTLISVGGISYLSMTILYLKHYDRKKWESVLVLFKN